jgi:hypothetical protein
MAFRKDVLLTVQHMLAGRVANGRLEPEITLTEIRRLIDYAIIAVDEVDRRQKGGEIS